MQIPLKVLLIEDNDSDAALVIRTLEKANFHLTFSRVQSPEEMTEELYRMDWDIVISDYSLPQFNAQDSLKILLDSGLDIPFIVVSGTIGEETAVLMMKAGAQDYLMKGNLARLAPAVTRELADAKVRRDQRATSQAFIESEAKFKAILDNSTDAIGVSLHGIHVFQNPAYIKIFGYSHQDEFIGKPLIDIIAPEEKNRITDYVSRRAYDSSLPVEYETIGLKKDGSVFDIEIRVSLFEYMGEQHTLTIIRDISERKRSEIALRKGYEELSTIYQVSQKFQQITTPETLAAELMKIMNETLHYTYGAVLLFDEQKKYMIPYSLSMQGTGTGIRSENEELTEFVRLNPGEGITGWVGQYGESVIIGDVSKDPRYHALRTNVKSELCVPLKINDEILGVLNVESDEPNAYIESDKRILEVLAAQIAIAIENSYLLEKLREELKIRTQAETRAEESNLMKSSLMMNMSHEVRTPMNAILGFSSIIKVESEQDEIRDMADRIRVSGERLMKTLDDILELAQLQSGSELLNLQEMELTSMLGNVKEEFGNQAAAKNLSFNIKFNQKFYARVDVRLFEKAIRELVNNAIKYTDIGSVSLEVSESSDKNQPFVEIRITDTGIGIAREHHKVIFESFRQVSSGYGRVYEGSGLGLTIAKQIIDLLNGTIEVESEIGKGSVLIVKLPCLPDSRRLSPITEIPALITGFEPKVQPEMSNGKPLVLLVEDNDDNIFVTTVFCRSMYDIETAKDGMEAIRMAGQRRYDAILMDINLGSGIDGIEATQGIKNGEMNKVTPVIAMTGFTYQEDKNRIMAGGCDYYLKKPFTKKEVLSFLETAINAAETITKDSGKN